MNRADFSSCGTYRFRLERDVPGQRDLGQVCWIMLNPSTADATKNDATIRTCLSFSEVWGFSTLVVVNLFAYRATDPKALRLAGEYRRTAGDHAWLIEAALAADFVVCAWGRHGEIEERGTSVEMDLRSEKIEAWRIGRPNVDRSPRHPLYLRRSTLLERHAT